MKPESVDDILQKQKNDVAPWESYGTGLMPVFDFREDQCKVWNPFFEHEGIKHHWLPYQHPERKFAQFSSGKFIFNHLFKFTVHVSTKC